MSQPAPGPVVESTSAAPLPAFLPPSRPLPARRFDPTPTPSSPAQVDELSPLEQDEPAGGSAWEDETPETLTATSSPASTDRPAIPRLDAASRKVYAVSIARGAQVAAAVVDARMPAPDGAFLMLDEEADNIARPASRILARRAPLPVPGGAAGATDAADAVELVSALIGYVMAAVARRRSAIVEGSALPALPARDERMAQLEAAPVVDEAPAAAPRPYFPGAPALPVIGAGA